MIVLFGVIIGLITVSASYSIFNFKQFLCRSIVFTIDIFSVSIGHSSNEIDNTRLVSRRIGVIVWLSGSIILIGHYSGTVDQLLRIPCFLNKSPGASNFSIYPRQIEPHFIESLNLIGHRTSYNKLYHNNLLITINHPNTVVATENDFFELFLIR